MLIGLISDDETAVHWHSTGTEPMAEKRQTFKFLRGQLMLIPLEEFLIKCNIRLGLLCD